MKTAVVWQRIEGLIVFVAGLLLAWECDAGVPWWAGLLIFFAPDLSFGGYLLGPKVGAVGYNLVHIYAFGAVFIAVGILMSHPLCTLAGALWMAHTGFDRMLGYGLKLPEGFSYTHLGGCHGRRGKPSFAGVTNFKPVACLIALWNKSSSSEPAAPGLPPRSIPRARISRLWC